MVRDAELHTLRKDMNCEGVGVPVQEDIAALVDSLFESSLPEDKMKE